MMRSKKAAAPLVLPIALAIIGLVVLVSFGIISTADVLGSKYIEAPYFASIKCEQSGSAKSVNGDIDTGGEWISDKLPPNTDEWSLTITSATSVSHPPQIEYYICGPQRQKLDNCQHEIVNMWDRRILNLPAVSSDDYVWVQNYIDLGLFWRSREGLEDATYKVTYKPYLLVREDRFRGGSQQLSEELGCKVPYSDVAWSNRVISYTGEAEEAETRDLDPNEYFNYISGTVTRAREGNVQEGGYCVYSDGEATIYAIEELKTGSGSYNVVNIDKKIGFADCCDGQNLPGQKCVDGQWVSTVEAQCSLFDPCEGSEWRRDYTATRTLVKFKCVDGQCVEETKEVECTRDSECATNQYCSTLSWTCKDAGIGGSGEERVPTDQQSCLDKGWEWVPETTTKRLFSEETIPAHCEEPSGFDWMMLVYILGGAFVLYVFRGPIIGVTKRILGLIGI